MYGLVWPCMVLRSYAQLLCLFSILPHPSVSKLLVYHKRKVSGVFRLLIMLQLIFCGEYRIFTPVLGDVRKTVSVQGEIW